jgi:hypothetical protein
MSKRTEKAWCAGCRAETTWEGGVKALRCLGCKTLFPCANDCDHWDCMEVRGEAAPDERGVLQLKGRKRERWERARKESRDAEVQDVLGDDAKGPRRSGGKGDGVAAKPSAEDHPRNASPPVERRGVPLPHDSDLVRVNPSPSPPALRRLPVISSRPAVTGRPRVPASIPRPKPHGKVTDKVCARCPFRPDGKGYAQGHSDLPTIIAAVEAGRPFYCHQTVIFDKRTRMTAGAPDPEWQSHFEICHGGWKRRLRVWEDRVLGMLAEREAKKKEGSG